MTYGGRSFTAPGPRNFTTRTEDVKTELKLVIQQVITGALLLDLALAIVQSSALVFQRWTLAIIGVILFAAPSLAVRKLTDWWKTKRGDLVFWIGIATASVVPAAICFARMDIWWHWQQEGMAAFVQCWQILWFPYRWWMLLLLGLIWLFGAVKHLGKVALAFDVVLIVAWGWAFHTSFNIKLPLLHSFTVGVPLDPQPFQTVLDHLLWIAFPHGAPWIFFMVVGALRMLSEGWGGGSTPITLMPAKVGEVSFLDLLFPGLTTKSLSKASDVEVAHVERVLTTRTDARAGESTALSEDIPLPSRHASKGYIGFYRMLRDLLNGTLALAWEGNLQQTSKYGYSQREFRGWDDAQQVHHPGLREAFTTLQYGSAASEKAPFIFNEEFLWYAVPRVVQQFGLDVLPEDLHVYATSPTP